MQKVLTVIFKDVEEVSEVSLRSIPENKGHVVLITDNGKVAIKISELEQALAEIVSFNCGV